MIGVGGATVATTELGAGKIKMAQNTFTITLILISSFAIFITIIGSFFIDPLVSFLGAEETLKSNIIEYLSVILGFFLFFMLTFVMDTFVRSDGNPTFSVIALVAAALLNIFLDYTFIAKFNWGLTGAALATGLSQLVSIILLAGYLLMGNTRFKIVKPDFDLKKIKRLLFNGSSELVNEMSVGISTFIFNLILISRFGSLGVAAYSVVGYGTMIIIMIFIGIAQATHPAISYNLGAGNLNRIKQFLRIGLIVNFVLGFIMFLILFFFAGDLATIFTNDSQELIDLTVIIGKRYSFAYLFSGANILISMFFTSMHRAMDSIVIALSRSLIFILIGLAILPKILGDNGIWLAVLFAEVMTFLVTLVLFKIKPLDERNIEAIKKLI